MNLHDIYISDLTYKTACKRVFRNKDIEKIKYLSKRYGKSFSQTLKFIIDRADILFYCL